MGRLEKLRQRLMTRPVEMDFADIRLLLETDGWTLARVTGSHHHFRKSGQRRITVSVHNGKVRKPSVQEIADRLGGNET